MRKIEHINYFCVGCGACHSALGTELETIGGGFPNVNIKDEKEVDFYENVCPVYYYSHKCEHDVWGRIEKAYVGYSSDEEIRFKASSGGAITEICLYLLREKIVDGIIHTTFDPNNPTKTVSCISVSEEEVKNRCGSRYSISVPLYEILQRVEIDKRYAFVGKPCDVMALRNLMRRNSTLEKQIKCLISFFCAGEPSEEAQKNMMNQIGCDIENCKELTYRGNGWPGYTTAVDKDGNKMTMKYKDAWGKYLGRDLRTICRFCLDGTGDAADIVCADFWILDKDENPDFSEHAGRNIVITRTQLGNEIVEASIQKGHLVVEEDFTEKMDIFYKYQPHQYKRKGTMKSTILAMRILGRKVPKYSNSYLNVYSAHLPGKVKFRYFLGTIKRILRGRI